jgi:hypothetical protein
MGGPLHWFNPARPPLKKTALSTPEGEFAVVYTFNKHLLKHRFCPTCGIHPYAEGTDRNGKRHGRGNIDCVEGIDLASIPVTHFDGRRSDALLRVRWRQRALRRKNRGSGRSAWRRKRTTAPGACRIALALARRERRDAACRARRDAPLVIVGTENHKAHAAQLLAHVHALLGQCRRGAGYLAACAPYLLRAQREGLGSGEYSMRSPRGRRGTQGRGEHRLHTRRRAS